MNRNFKEIGSEVKIYDPVTIIAPEKMSLKSHILISEFSYLASGLGTFIGNFIHISAHSIISGGGYCILEDFVGLSAGVKLITGSEDISGKGLTNPTIPKEYRSYYRSYVICEKHSFLGTNVTVNPGVTIGEGAVIGSGSVVTKDVPPWTINIGSPTKVIRAREKNEIKKLEREILNKMDIESSNFLEFKKLALDIKLR